MRNIISRRAFLSVGASAAFIGAPCCVTAGVNEWTPIGPDGGRAHDVEFSHTSPGTFYALGWSGVYRSTVAGDSFELLREDFGGTPSDLAVDPARADRVLVVAVQGLHVGVGATWTPTTAPLLDPGTKVATSRDGARAYFAAGTRIFRSQDRGATWQERAPIPAAPQSLVNALQVDPTNADVVYANSYGGGLFRSTDGGAAWQPLGVGAISFVLNFVVDPSNPQRLFAATNDAGLRISLDGGSTWSATSVTAQIWDVDVDPQDPSVIYVAGTDVRKSTDNGTTWTVLNVDQPPGGSLRLAIDPTQPSRLAVFNGQGVSVSTDSGATWAKRIAGFKGTVPTAFSALPSSRRSYFGLSGPGAVFYVEDGGAMVRSVNNDPLTLLAQQQDFVNIQVLALPGAADTLYAVLKQQILAKSTNAGLHWSRLAFPGLSVAYIAGSPLEPQTLYVSGSPGPLYKSMDGGATWATIGAGLPAGFRFEQIAIASTPSTLYAIGVLAGSSLPGSPPSEWRVYRSADAGATWSAASPLQTQPIYSVTVDPRDAQVVYAGFGSELRKTTDGGASWATLDRNGSPLCCSFRSVVFDATNTNVFYALHAAVVRTVDGGASWENVFTPSSQTFTASGTLVLDPTNASRLLVGWFERGVREFTIAPDLALAPVPASAPLASNVPGSYRLQVRNLGPFHATNVRVTVQLSPELLAVTASASGAVCTVSALTATCTFGVVRAGGPDATMTIGFTPPAGSITVPASVTADQPDPVMLNNNAVIISPSPPPTDRSDGGGGATSFGTLAFLLALGVLRRWVAGQRERPSSVRRRF